MVKKAGNFKEFPIPASTDVIKMYLKMNKSFVLL
jgi:hypothetical protein